MTSPNNCTYLLDSALTKISTETAKFPRQETGGILIGYNIENATVITHASGPGPSALHMPQHFQMDHRYTQAVLNLIFDKTAGALTFLGDWHTHPFGPAEPSLRDFLTIKDLARNTKARTATPLILIYTPEIQILSLKYSPKLFIGRWSNKNNVIQPVPPNIIEGIPGYDLPFLVV